VQGSGGLTEAGRALHEQTGPILSRVQTVRETMADLTAGETGDIRVGAIEPIASRRLPPILVRYCRERPKVRLAIAVGGTDSVARGVAAGDLDVGLCSPPPPGLALTFEPLFREPMGLLVPNGRDPVPADPVRPAEIGDAGARPATTIEIGSIEALIWAVQAGLGVAIVPAIAAPPPPAVRRPRGFAGHRSGPCRRRAAPG
jgi:DNA-binding transcriptional LysR family regulator